MTDKEKAMAYREAVRFLDTCLYGSPKLNLMRQADKLDPPLVEYSAFRACRTAYPEELEA